MYNDYELVFLAQDGNEEASNLIYNKYKPIIIKKSKNAMINATHHGVEINDIMQEGFIGLEEAIRNFSQNTEATFYTFALLCIDRQIANFIKKINTNKDRVLNNSITIDDNLENVVRDKNNVELTVLGNDYDDNIIKKLRNILTDFEGKVFYLRMQEYTIDEIAKKLDKDVKSIYNTFQRIKIKFKKISKIDD